MPTLTFHRVDDLDEDVASSLPSSSSAAGRSASCGDDAGLVGGDPCQSVELQDHAAAAAAAQADGDAGQSELQDSAAAAEASSGTSSSNAMRPEEPLPKSWQEARASSSVVALAIDIFSGRLPSDPPDFCTDDDGSFESSLSLSSVTSMECSDGGSWACSDSVSSSDSHSSDDEFLVPEKKAGTAKAKKEAKKKKKSLSPDQRLLFDWSDDEDCISDASNWSDGPKSKRRKKNGKKNARSSSSASKKKTKESKAKKTATKSTTGRSTKQSKATNAASDGFDLGTNVVLQNLVSGAQYNGKLGVVVSSVRNGRQDVKIPSMGGRMVAAKIENIRSLPALFKYIGTGDCGGNANAAAATPPSCGGRGPFSVGARVVLQKLVSGGAQYNGRYGIVRSAVREGRQTVEILGMGKLVAVRIANMRPNGKS